MAETNEGLTTERSQSRFQFHIVSSPRLYVLTAVWGLHSVCLVIYTRVLDTGNTRSVPRSFLQSAHDFNILHTRASKGELYFPLLSIWVEFKLIFCDSMTFPFKQCSIQQALVCVNGCSFEMWADTRISEIFLHFSEKVLSTYFLLQWRAVYFLFGSFMVF